MRRQIISAIVQTLVFIFLLAISYMLFWFIVFTAGQAFKAGWSS